MGLQPDAEVCRALTAAVVNEFGAQYRDFYRVEWREDRGCLCIIERKLFHTADKPAEYVKDELRDEMGDARQVHMGDVHQLISQSYARRENANAVADFYRRKDEQKAARKAQMAEVAEETLKELHRVVRHGLRAYSLPAQAPKEESAEGFRVIDRRRVS